MRTIGRGSKHKKLFIRKLYHSRIYILSLCACVCVWQLYKRNLSLLLWRTKKQSDKHNSDGHLQGKGSAVLTGGGALVDTVNSSCWNGQGINVCSEWTQRLCKTTGILFGNHLYCALYIFGRCRLRRNVLWIRSDDERGLVRNIKSICTCFIYLIFIFLFLLFFLRFLFREYFVIIFICDEQFANSKS